MSEIRLCCTQTYEIKVNFKEGSMHATNKLHICKVGKHNVYGRFFQKGYFNKSYEEKDV